MDLSSTKERTDAATNSDRGTSIEWFAEFFGTKLHAAGSEL